MAVTGGLKDYHELLGKIESDLAGVPFGLDLYVAVSGGRDSVLLLHVLQFFFTEKKRFRSLTVVHFNHNLRGLESDADAAFVKDLAEELGVDCLVQEFHYDRNTKKSQALYRKMRQEFYASIQARNSQAIIALGHHCNDQAETVLSRIMRGTGMEGLRAMKVYDGQYLRPFLKILDSQIQEVAIGLGMKWREDSSNADVSYERNWIRQEIIPLMEQRRGGVVEKIANLAFSAQETLDHLSQAEFSSEQLTMQEAEQFAKQTVWQRKDFLRHYKTVLRAQWGLERVHIESIERALQGQRSILDLPRRRLQIGPNEVRVQLRSK